MYHFSGYLVQFLGVAYYLDGLGSSMFSTYRFRPSSSFISGMPNFMRMCGPATCSGLTISIGHGWISPFPSSPDLALLLSSASDTRTSLVGVSSGGVSGRFVGGAFILTCGDGASGVGALVRATASCSAWPVPFPGVVFQRCCFLLMFYALS